MQGDVGPVGKQHCNKSQSVTLFPSEGERIMKKASFSWKRMLCSCCFFCFSGRKLTYGCSLILVFTISAFNQVFTKVRIGAGHHLGHCFSSLYIVAFTFFLFLMPHCPCPTTNTICGRKARMPNK